MYQGCVLSGGMYIPSNNSCIPNIKKELLVKKYNMVTNKVTYIRNYIEYKQGVIVPRNYGYNLIKNYKDNTQDGVEIGRILKPATLREYQVPVVDKIVKCSKSYKDFLFVALQGKGKTVMSIESARRIGRCFVVLVDMNSLMQQWKDTAINIFGMNPGRIGTIQGDIADYKNKDMVVCMVQTLYNRKLDRDFNLRFGTLIIDEFHSVAAPEKYSKVLFKIGCSTRFGVSATPYRGDDLQSIIHSHMGQVRVTLDETHKKSIVRYLYNKGVYSNRANSSPNVGVYITELSKDKTRNLLIARAIRGLWGEGRDILVVSDRILQLVSLKSLCQGLGIPEEDMVMMSRYDYKWGYYKDTKRKRKPKGYVKGTKYTPVIFMNKAIKITNEQMELRKNIGRVKFATYGTFGKGIDVPQLDTGIEATPRSSIRQVHGRILRVVEGKKTPIWITIRDVYSYRSERSFLSRLKDYLLDNSEVYLWTLGEGAIKVDCGKLESKIRKRITQLRTKKIVTGLDGKNTIV